MHDRWGGMRGNQLAFVFLGSLISDTPVAFHRPPACGEGAGYNKTPDGPLVYIIRLPTCTAEKLPVPFAENWVQTRKETLVVLRMECFLARCRPLRSMMYMKGLGVKHFGDWTTAKVSLRTFCK